MLQLSEQHSSSLAQAPPETVQVPDAGALAQAFSGAAASTSTTGIT
ncbi:MAG: hypothetical protein IID33_16355 [Planctomycetes bacterium]|nr:hypothetical protein [Planctomycetota bacterium]